jgi:hypothetical protein
MGCLAGAAEAIDGRRPAYPAVEVHRQDRLARMLDDDVWYVYRDGKPLDGDGPDPATGRAANQPRGLRVGRHTELE